MMNNINADIELKIREGFSKDLTKFKNLKLWIDNTLSEIVLHHDNVYAYKTRIKTIESLLKKLDDKIETKNMDFPDYAHVKKVEDIIGARLIVYAITEMNTMHEFLLNFQRFTIKKVTAYDNEKEQYFKNISISNNIELEPKISPNGYVGLHYIIEPAPVDPFYSNGAIHNIFELQLRTLIQEAWGELQHDKIYKGRMPDKDKIAGAKEFARLADYLAVCDKHLGELAFTDS